MDLLKNPASDMRHFLEAFEGNPDRLAKYLELLLLNRNASPVSYQAKHNLLRISIVLTTKCNLQCIWCHRREADVQNYLNHEMDFKKVKYLLPHLKGFNLLHWSGLGEPFLYPALFELTKEARQIFPVVKITTNGTLLSAKQIDRLVDSGCNYLEVSIDGFDEQTNKRCRGFDQNEIIKNLKDLSNKSDIPIQINSVISATNYLSLFDAVDLLKEIKNIICLHTIPLFMTQYMLAHQIKPISPEQHKSLLSHWKNRIEIHDLSWRLTPNVWSADLDPVITMKRNHNICFSVFEHPFINVFGDMVPCGRLQHIRLDNVFKTNFETAWNGPAFLKWRQDQLQGDFSHECSRECYMKKPPSKTESAPGSFAINSEKDRSIKES